MYEEQFTISFNKAKPTEDGLVLVFLNGLAQSLHKDYYFAPDRSGLRWYKRPHRGDNIRAVFQTKDGWADEEVEIR